MPERADIWVLTDGRAGNEAQALGLAEALARTKPATVAVKRIGLRGWATILPPALSHWLSRLMPGWPYLGLSKGGDELTPPWPDLIVGAGRRAAPIVAALRRQHRVPAVQLLNPQMPVRAFDAVVVPDHDALRGTNVLTSLGALTRMTPQRISYAAASWAKRLERLRQPRLAVLIGGPSRSARFTEADQQHLVQALRAILNSHSLMITTSRRTPEMLTESLHKLPDDRTFLWTGEGENPYPAILGHADAVLVSEDSVNMASEAATTGLPVHVFGVAGVAGKLRRFHQSLAARGAARTFTGVIESWSYEPLAEADRIAGELQRRGLI